MLEVLKILFADRDAYLGDPTVVDAPVDMLIDKAYAARRRAEIDPRRARRFQAGALVSGEGQNTTHITVMDAQGSVVTMTQTLNQMFGARAVIPGTGLLLSDTMALFDPRPDRPNSVAPGKRPLTSTAATIVLRDGQARFAVGTPGASPIFPAVLQCLPNVVDHGMTLQEATEAPRVYADSYVEELEAEVPAEVQEALTALGHTIMVVPRVAGGMNGVRYDPETGLLEGAACWRADGAPAGLSGGAARPGASRPR